MHNRFKDILSNIQLYNNPHPNYHNRSWMIHPLIQAFNDQMEECFNPSWLNCLDESMVAFLNKHCPNWVRIKRKPHPLENEYHTIACCLSKIIFCMELVEMEKDSPKGGPFAKPEFKDMMTKTTALCIPMTKSIWGTKRVCLVDSGFGYISTLPELEKSKCMVPMFLSKREITGQRGPMQRKSLSTCKANKLVTKLPAKALTQIIQQPTFG